MTSREEADIVVDLMAYWIREEMTTRNRVYVSPNGNHENAMGEVEEHHSLLAMVTRDVVERGVKAGDLVRQAAVHIDGKGGGRPDLAEAGGKDASGLDAAIAAAEDLIRSQLDGAA